MNIRVLQHDDVDQLREMTALFGRAFDDPEHYDHHKPTTEYLSGLLRNPMFVAISASDGGRVVGGLAGYILPKFEQARSELYIYDLAVDEAFRRRGVATRLIEAAQVLARDRGAWVVYVQADPEDEPAVALYTKLGTREDVLHFDIPPAGRDE
jgi:aminoglycoside 3-N-acetyltransferase I